MDHGDIDRELALNADRLGIPLPEAWRPAVRDHLLEIRKAIDILDGFPLPDEIDPAPVFEA